MDERGEDDGRWADGAPAVDAAVLARWALIFPPLHRSSSRSSALRTDSPQVRLDGTESTQGEPADAAPVDAVAGKGNAGEGNSAQDDYADAQVSSDELGPGGVGRSGAGDGLGLADWAVPGVDRPVLPLSPSAQVQALQAAVRALVGCRPGELSPEQAIVDLAAVLAASEQLARVRVDRLADAHHRSLFQHAGARSATAWLHQHSPVAPAELKVARKLQAFPALGAALLSGTLPVPVVDKLQRALSTVRPHLDAPDGLLDGRDAEAAVRNVITDGVRMAIAQARGGFPSHDDPLLVLLLRELPTIAALPVSQLARVEQALLLLAAHVEPAQLGPALEMLLGGLLPSRLEDAADRAHARRSFHLTQDPDGAGWTVDGHLDLLTGERLRLVLDAGMRTDPDNPLDTAKAEQLREQGHDPDDPDLAPSLSPRSRAQQRHDALSAALAGYLAADLAGSHDKNPVQIVVDLTLPQLTGEPGALPARTSTGTLLPRSIWTSLACGAGFTRHLLDLRGKVIETSHTSRTLKAHERRALHSQTGGTCQGAGCTNSTRQPGTVLHPHHGDPWSRSGTTSLHDTAHVCDSCHRHLHRGHPLRLKDGRLLGPDGWILE